jgi:hypothetical protein
MAAPSSSPVTSNLSAPGTHSVQRRAFEHWAHKTAGIKILRYRANNGIFNSHNFMAHVAAMEQQIDFCSVGAHHQNGVAKRAIRTVTEMACAMLLHAVLHWPDETDLSLWPFAMDQAVYVWIHLPNRLTGISPIELFTKSLVTDYRHLTNLHVFGCPCYYVLDPVLQGGKKLPK